MVEEIKELRVKIDGLSQLVKELKPLKTIDVRLRDSLIHTFTEEDLNNYEFVIRGKVIDASSPELYKAYDSLILGKAWLGKVFGELGESTPYTNDGKRKTVEDIEPTADTVNVDYKDGTSISSMSQISNVMDFESKTYIEKVDWLREEIKEINDKVKEQLHFVESERMLLLERVEQHLSEARFWLGFELQHIKEE